MQNSRTDRRDVICLRDIAVDGDVVRDGLTILVNLRGVVIERDPDFRGRPHEEIGGVDVPIVNMGDGDAWAEVGRRLFGISCVIRVTCGEHGQILEGNVRRRRAGRILKEQRVVGVDDAPKLVGCGGGGG